MIIWVYSYECSIWLAWFRFRTFDWLTNLIIGKSKHFIILPWLGFKIWLTNWHDFYKNILLTDWICSLKGGSPCWTPRPCSCSRHRRRATCKLTILLFCPYSPQLLKFLLFSLFDKFRLLQKTSSGLLSWWTFTDNCWQDIQNIPLNEEFKCCPTK